LDHLGKNIGTELSDLITLFICIILILTH